MPLTLENYFTNPFDLDINISELNVVERYTYNAVRNIILDKESNWKHGYYKQIVNSNYDAYASEYTHKLAHSQKDLDSFTARLDALQAKNNLSADQQTEMNALKISIVTSLNDIDMFTDAIHTNSYKAYTERVYNNTLYTIACEFKYSNDRERLINSTKSLMRYYTTIQTA